MVVSKMNPILSLLNFCLLLVSCQTSQTTTTAPAPTPVSSAIASVQSNLATRTTKSDTFVFHYTDFENSAGECDSALAACAKITFRYPIFSDFGGEKCISVLNQAIQQFLLTSATGDSMVSPDLETFSENFFREYGTMREDIPDYVVGWELNREVQVIYNSSKITSLCASSYAFTGGAHGNSSVQMASFRRATGERVQLSDILSADALDRLNTIAEKNFRRDREIPDNLSLEEAGYWFKDNQFMLNDNFAVGKSGLIFHFNQYEIAPYAFGPIDVTIGYDQIDPITKIN